MTIERIVGGRAVVGPIIGRGRTSVVHEGTLLGTGERVAVKITSSRFAPDAAMRMRTEHALHVFDAGPGWLVMERLFGALLASEIERQGPCAIPRGAALALQVCEAVAEAHALGLVHGDLGPHRIVVTTRADGSPAVRVLGFARPSAGGDSRIDVFGIGIILHALVGDVTSVSPPFAATVARCVAPNPDDRFQTIEELAETLARFAPPDAARYAARVRAAAAIAHSGGVMVISEPPPELDASVVKPRKIVRPLAMAVAVAALGLLAFGRDDGARTPAAAVSAPPPAVALVASASATVQNAPPPPSAPSMPRPSPPKSRVRRSAERPRS
jgi:hypothetical protein